MYNSLFLDQWMLLDRRTILMEEDQYMKSKNQKKETKVYICTTMYREVRLIYLLTLLCYRTYSLCLLSIITYNQEAILQESCGSELREHIYL